MNNDENRRWFNYFCGRHRLFQFSSSQMLLWGRKKMSRFTFLISFEVIRVSPRYLRWISTNIISFFSENFTVEISTPVEYSTKIRFLGYSKSAQKWHLTSKNPIFWRFQVRYAQYLGNFPKWSKDILYNLWIINIGRIGRFI